MFKRDKVDLGDDEYFLCVERGDRFSLSSRAQIRLLIDNHYAQKEVQIFFGFLLRGVHLLVVSIFSQDSDLRSKAIDLDVRWIFEVWTARFKLCGGGRT